MGEVGSWLNARCSPCIDNSQEVICKKNDFDCLGWIVEINVSMGVGIFVRAYYSCKQLHAPAFQAMKAVEVAVRDAARLGEDLVGVKLMRAAFAPENGPLTDANSEGGEKVAWRISRGSRRAIWRRRNPTRQRLPWHFESVIALKFFELQPGSTGVPLYRAELLVGNEEPLLPLEDEVDEAAVLLDDVMAAAVAHQPIPKFFPRGIIPLFDQFGQTLRPDEFILIAPANRPRAVRYDRNVRATLLGWAAERYKDVIDLVGEVRGTDLDGQKFSLRLSDGRKIPGRFRPDQEALILEALNEHASRRLRIAGSGEFSHENGALQQIVSVDRIEVLPATGRTAAEVPIWKRISQLGMAVPDGAWEAVPGDLSQNIEQYLYGRRDGS